MPIQPRLCDAAAMREPPRFRPTPVLRPRRRRILASVGMTDADGRRYTIVVENVSNFGLKARAADGPPAPGTPVIIDLPKGAPIWGVVRWCCGTEFGVEVRLEETGDDGAGLPAG